MNCCILSEYFIPWSLFYLFLIQKSKELWFFLFGYWCVTSLLLKLRKLFKKIILIFPWYSSSLGWVPFLAAQLFPAGFSHILDDDLLCPPSSLPGTYQPYDAREEISLASRTGDTRAQLFCLHYSISLASSTTGLMCWSLCPFPPAQTLWSFPCGTLWCTPISFILIVASYWQKSKSDLQNLVPQSMDNI